jgi:hypothetical protein
LAPEPSIVIRGTIEAPTDVMVAADKQMVCKVGGSEKIFNAYSCFMAVCYVFMFNYPPSVKNFCLYLQKCILQIRDGKKLPTNVISFVNDIDQLVSNGL